MFLFGVGFPCFQHVATADRPCLEGTMPHPGIHQDQPYALQPSPPCFLHKAPGFTCTLEIQAPFVKGCRLELPGFRKDHFEEELCYSFGVFCCLCFVKIFPFQSPFETFSSNPSVVMRLAGQSRASLFLSMQDFPHTHWPI